MSRVKKVKEWKKTEEQFIINEIDFKTKEPISVIRINDDKKFKVYEKVFVHIGKEISPYKIIGFDEDKINVYIQANNFRCLPINDLIIEDNYLLTSLEHLFNKKNKI